MFTFGNKHLTLSFDAGTGALVRLTAGTRELAAAAPDIPAVDVKLNDRWLSSDSAASRLINHETDPQTGALTVTRAAGVWEIAERYTLDPDAPRLARQVTLIYRGTARAKLKGVRFLTPGVTAAGEGFYVLPRNYPPARYPFAALKEGQVHGNWARLAPAFAQIAPDCTLMWAADGRKDNAHVEVQEGNGRFSVRQFFDALGWVNPGDKQEVGTAYLEVLPLPYSRALPSLWAWMDRIGLRVPADRPQWVQDAVLYSFHPGGAIGSNLRDLGGFRAATTDLLPRLPELGINAIWIMPIEDLSLYNPRDYYKFQQGLGSPQEYRDLVACAHALGMHVLQDCVPHGGSSDFPRAKQHPEWLVRDEEGNTLGYWCFDFRWPSWQQYMADVASYYVKNYDVDGYRVDAVSGSKIPNWSPNIPYARASLSQLEGGLGMLRALRGAVKTLKPGEGAILGETEGAPYAGEADAVYDFALCYQVLQDLRDQSPAEFVSRLQTWLEEQKYTDPRGTVRLRHVESHDSLRSQGWYGVMPMRALTALSAWIDGMPLVYQGMETGNGPALRQIFEIRRSLPELNRGEAFYQSVNATPGVFTCLRRLGENSSLVAINLNPEPTRASFSLPLQELGFTASGRYAIWEAGSKTRRLVSGSELGQLTRQMAPYEATVLAFRPDGVNPFVATGAEQPPTAPTLGKQEKPEQIPAPPAPPRLSATEAITYANAHYRLTLDRRTGLIRSLTRADGKPLLGGGDLLLDSASAVLAKPAALTQRTAGATRIFEFTGALPQGSYTLRYRLDKSATLGVECAFDAPAQRAALLFPATTAKTWAVDTIEGRLEDTFHPHPRAAKEEPSSSIYWRPQGTSILWQAETTPLRPGGAGVVARRADQSGVAIAAADPFAAAPEALQLLDRFAGHDGLHLLAAARCPVAGQRSGTGHFRLNVSVLAPNAPAPVAKAALPAGVTLRHTGLDWVIENAHYRAVLRRTGGVLKQLWLKQPRERLVLDKGDLYADRGFSSDNKRFCAADDVETGARYWREGDALHLRFSGQMRGAYRFDRSQPPLEYYQEYIFTAGASFRSTWGIRSGRQISHGEGFLAAVWRVPEGTAFTFQRDGKTLSEGVMARGARQGETARLAAPAVPDAIRLADNVGTLFRFTELQTAGPAGLRNVFVDTPLLFAAWLDGKTEELAAGSWHEASTVITAGDAAPQALPAPVWEKPAVAQASVLRDASFEDGGDNTLTLLRAGAPEKLPGSSVNTVWAAPAEGSLTGETAHTGHFSAKVSNPGGSYALWRQSLDMGAFPPGSRVRLSAWVKADGVTQGDAGWKTGTLRLQAIGQQSTYLEAVTFTGSFDWKRLSGEVTIPEGTKGLDLQIGLNGATGVCWLDDITLERLP